MYYTKNYRSEIFIHYFCDGLQSTCGVKYTLYNNVSRDLTIFTLNLHVAAVSNDYLNMPKPVVSLGSRHESV